MLRLLVSTRFQVLFHSAPAVLFTFPSRYYPLSVAKEYLALGGGPPRFPRDFSCPAVLGVCCHPHAARFGYRALTVSGRPSHAVLLHVNLGLATLQLAANSPSTPHTHRLQPVPRIRFRLLRFRSPLLTESLLLSLPRGTEMFQFPRFPASSLSAVPLALPASGFPIRTSTDQSSLTAPRGISVFAPSFFGSWRLGILRALFLASPFTSPYSVAKVP